MQGVVTWAFAFAFAELPSFGVLELSPILSRDDALLSLRNACLGTDSRFDDDRALSALLTPSNVALGTASRVPTLL